MLTVGDLRKARTSDDPELTLAHEEHVRAWRAYRQVLPSGFDPVLFAPVRAANERIGMALLRLMHV